MKKKKQFERPQVLQELTLLPDTPILAGSVSDDMIVVSTGQDVENYDFSDDEGFVTDWD